MTWLGLGLFLVWRMLGERSKDAELEVSDEDSSKTS
jgi:hypothetical protein